MLLVGINAKFIHSNLAIRYLAQIDKRCAFCEYTVSDRPEHIAKNLYRTGKRTFFFSCYIWNIEHVLKICSILKEADSGLRLVLGGPEVSFNPEELLQNHLAVDFVLCGEGEPSLKLFIDSLQTGDFTEVPGLYYRQGGEVTFSAVPPQEADLATLPFPYTAADIKHLKNRIVYFETSRGCPYRCAFCLSGGAGSLRFLPLAKVEEAIRFFGSQQVPLVKLVDRTFNADPKRALAIIEAIKAQGGNTTYHFEIRAESMTEELIQSLQSAPCGMFQLEIGVQSLNVSTLENINRKPALEKLFNVVQALMKNGNMHLHLDLIAGLPGETLEAFIRSFNQLMQLRPHNLQLGFLKKLKGATLLAPGSAFWDFPPYEVIHSDAMCYQDLLFLHDAEEMLERYYNSGAFCKTMAYLLDRYYAGHAFDFFSDMAAYLAKDTAPKSQKAMFEALYSFSLKRFNDQHITSCLIYDYCFLHRDSLSFMKTDKSFKNLVFEFLKKPDRVAHHFAHYAGEKPVVLYKKIRFQPIGGRVIAFDYARKTAIDVTAEFE